MLRFTILAVLFAAVCAGLINDKLKNADLDVTVVDNFDDYLAENPEVELLEQLVQEEVRDRNQIKYTLGNHVNGTCVSVISESNQQIIFTTVLFSCIFRRSSRCRSELQSEMGQTDKRKSKVELSIKWCRFDCIIRSN